MAEIHLQSPGVVAPVCKRVAARMTRFTNAASSLARGRDHVVRRQRSSDPLQLELTDWFDLHGVLDLHQHARADEDLPRLGLVAKARGDVGNRSDGSIVEPALEADGAERETEIAIIAAALLRHGTLSGDQIIELANDRNESLSLQSQR